MTIYIKSEFKRALFSKNALVCFFITLSAFIIGFLSFVNFGIFDIYEFKGIYDCIDVFLMSEFFSVASILPLISPLLAAIVFSDSYLLDKNSGFLKLIYIRMSKKKYIAVRLIVNGITSGLIIVIASLIMLLFSVCIYGININPNNSMNISGAFQHLYFSNKWLYCIITIGVTFIFNVIFSTLALGVSTIINNKYLSFLVPFFYYILSGTVFIMLRLYKLNATYLFELKDGQSPLTLAIYQISLFAIGALLFYFGVLYRNEKDL